MMRVIAIGNKEMLIGFMLAGVKERLDTDDPDEALRFLHRLEEEETGCLVVAASDIYREIKEEIEEIQKRKPSFIFYTLSGAGLKWRRKG